MLQHGAISAPVKTSGTEGTFGCRPRSLGGDEDARRDAAVEGVPAAPGPAVAAVNIHGALDDVAGIHGQVHAR